MSTKKNISYRTRHYEMSTFFNASANLQNAVRFKADSPPYLHERLQHPCNNF